MPAISVPPTVPQPTWVQDYTAARSQNNPAGGFGWTAGFQGYNSAEVQIIAGGYGGSTNLPSLRTTSPAGFTNNHEGLRWWPDSGAIVPTTHMIREWFGFNVKFASDWPTNIGNWGGLVCQLGYGGFANHNWGLFVPITGRTLNLVLLTGYHQPPDGSVREYNNSFGAPQGPPPKVHTETQFPLNTWMQFIFDIQWSPVASTSTGYGLAPIATIPQGHTHIYYRLKGATSWTQTVNLPDVPTMAWGTGNGQGANTSLTINMINQNGNPIRETHKFGFYGGITGARTSEHANICKGSSFAIVEQQLNL
jgi:hypothetical protein